MRPRWASKACWRISGKRVGGDAFGLAGDDFEIRQVVGRRQAARRQHHGQVAKARILRQHGEEGIDDARAKALAEHDAVDVAVR